MPLYNSLQEVFNIVWEHAKLKQKSYLPDCGPHDVTKCAYRGVNGAKCFIGACIPDKEYSKDDEGYSVARLTSYKYLFGNIDYSSLEKLQAIHDGCYTYEWENRLRTFANDRKLTVPA